GSPGSFRPSLRRGSGSRTAGPCGLQCEPLRCRLPPRVALAATVPCAGSSGGRISPLQVRNSGRSGGAGSQMPKIFYVTDIHGSEICWQKFLNAGSFYKADAVILGGDITGKAMVPIVQTANGTWDASLQDHHQALESEDAIKEFEARVMNRGYYPIRVSEEEYRHMQEAEE